MVYEYISMNDYGAKFKVLFFGQILICFIVSIFICFFNALLESKCMSYVGPTSQCLFTLIFGRNVFVSTAFPLVVVVVTLKI